MTAVRFAGQQIESWNPAIDVRSVEAGRLFVLQGKNYLFDSKGPKSGFGHRLVNGGNLGNLSDIQSLDIDKQTLLFASNGIYRQEYALPAEADALEPTTWWRRLKFFDESEKLFRFGSNRWSGAYLNGATFVGEEKQGLYLIKRLEAVKHTADGVPSDPIAVRVIAGRLIVLTRQVMAWSGPGNGYDFQPFPGGAGFQKLIQYMSGEPIAITSSEKIIVIWTRNSAMLAEYIGGQAVFRFDAFESELFPVGPMAVTQDANNRAYMMTRHGLALIQGTQLQIDATPAFNQMIREYLNDSPHVEVRLDYILEQDLLFVQIADSANMYQRTFVLAVTIDKWGSFDEEHLGICRFGEQQGFTGFADLDGYLHKFTDTPDREFRGKGLIGLDSFIDIGYVNNPDMIIQSDTMIEMQELTLSARMNFPDQFANLTITDLQGLGDWWGVVTGEYINEDWNILPFELKWNEDWNTDDDDSEVIDDDLNNEGEDEVIDDDLNMAGEEEYSMGSDYNDGSINSNEDWNLAWYEASGIDWNKQTIDDSDDWNTAPMTSTVVPNPLDYDDWNLTSQPDEDWNGPYSFLNFITYDPVILSSMHGLESGRQTAPKLAIPHVNRDLWTMFTAGRFQTVRLSAQQRWQKYHVTQIDASVNYYGQYS